MKRTPAAVVMLQETGLVGYACLKAQETAEDLRLRLICAKADHRLRGTYGWVALAARRHVGLCWPVTGPASGAVVPHHCSHGIVELPGWPELHAYSL